MLRILHKAARRLLVDLALWIAATYGDRRRLVRRCRVLGGMLP